MKDIAIEDYTYDLPPGKIATHPLPERDASRLLVYNQGTLNETVYREISEFLPEDSLIVFNQSKVLDARLVFTKSSGGRIEIFCLEPHFEEGGIQSALGAAHTVRWMCLIGGASKWKPGQVLEKLIHPGNRSSTLRATYSGKVNEAFVVTFTWDGDFSFAEVLHAAGKTPLPPYIKREADDDDAERYQTIYANQLGSVAAPTAGLHFTDHIMKNLERKNITRQFVTLHVGAGTFKPVKAATMAEHEMHAEFIDVNVDGIRQIAAFLGRHITAVGTTSIRTIESLYWMGVKIITQPVESKDDLSLSQWFAADHADITIPADQALEAVIKWLEIHKTDRLITSTQLLIAPGYRFRITDALVTNFHQPKSTLLLLIAAMAGENWRDIYDHALQNGFRFLSYGDGCLIFRRDAAL